MILVPPVVTDEAAGAAELLTVVLLLVVSAFEMIALVSKANASVVVGKYLISFRRETFGTVELFFYRYSSLWLFSQPIVG